MACARIPEFESDHPSHASVRGTENWRKLGGTDPLSGMGTTPHEPKLPYAERLIHSPHRAFGCFSSLILNDRAAPSYQLLDLSLAGLPLDMLFLIADLLSFEVGILALSFLGNCLPLINQPDPTSHSISRAADFQRVLADDEKQPEWSWWLPLPLRVASRVLGFLRSILFGQEFADDFVGIRLACSRCHRSITAKMVLLW